MSSCLQLLHGAPSAIMILQRTFLFLQLAHAREERFLPLRLDMISAGRVQPESDVSAIEVGIECTKVSCSEREGDRSVGRLFPELWATSGERSISISESLLSFKYILHKFGLNLLTFRKYARWVNSGI